MENTWKQILKTIGITDDEFNAKCEGLEDHEIAYRQLVLIAKVLNGDWKADFKNKDQIKYIPYFYDDGTGFSYGAYNYWTSGTSVGSRLCFKNFEVMKHAATEFIDIYRRFLD